MEGRRRSGSWHADHESFIFIEAVEYDLTATDRDGPAQTVPSPDLDPARPIRQREVEGTTGVVRPTREIAPDDELCIRAFERRQSARLVDRLDPHVAGQAQHRPQNN